MRTRIMKAFLLSAVLAYPSILTLGCAEEVAHSESDRPGWFGGHKHEETTVYRNPDGSTHVEHEKTSVNP